MFQTKFINTYSFLESKLELGDNWVKTRIETSFVSSHQLDLANLCTKAGLKNIGTVFLLTDAQVPEESFLVLINDLLASGEIPGLFADDEVENIISGVRNEVKGAGLQDTRENCWMFFIERVRRNLKVKQDVATN